MNYTESNINDELKMLRKIRENLVDELIMVPMNFFRSHLDEITKIKGPVVFSTMSLNGGTKPKITTLSLAQDKIAKLRHSMN